MPLYEYRCKQCDQVFEQIQKFSDAPLAVHEGCGGAVERLISAPGLQFKGSGWYITDYARGGSNGKSSDSSSSSTDTKGEKKTETKTDSTTKTETKSPAPTSSSSKSD